MTKYPYEAKTFTLRQESRLKMLTKEFYIHLSHEDKKYLLSAENDIQAEQRMRSIFEKYL